MKTLKNVLVLAALLLLSVNAARAGAISATAEVNPWDNPSYADDDDYIADAPPGMVYYYFETYDGGYASAEWTDANGYDSRDSTQLQGGGSTSHAGGELWCQATAYLTDPQGYAYAYMWMSW